jgi:glucose/arabinose dehydrogenase
MSRPRPRTARTAFIASLLMATGAAAQSAAPSLPPPLATPPATKFAKVVGWPAGTTPKAPPGFKVEAFASGLESPRWLYVLPGGEVLAAESRTEVKPEDEAKFPAELLQGFREAGNLGKSPNRVVLLVDKDKDGRAETRHALLENLNQPLGLLVHGGSLYVGNTDALLRFPWKAGATRITAPGVKILDLPAAGYNNHWTRNVLLAPDGKHLFVSVGSGTNVDEEKVDEKDSRRAAILEVGLDGKAMRVFASGLRNPVGMGVAPGTDTLFTVVNERDMLGDDLVPDYLTSVRAGAFYGWPYAYFGQNEDPRKKGERPDLVKKAVVPDVPLGAHTASLGLTFYAGQSFPERYRNGAFVGQHGSWNRSEFAGYKVAFVPFANGKPAGPPEDFLTGFVKNAATREVFGRPVGLAVLPDGSLLVADDAANTIWRVSAVK